MEFDSNKPIYLQISDRLCERILSGDLKPEDRILSVRELGAEIGVNPNTVARSYEKLTDAGIIYTKRGLGYFVAPGRRKSSSRPSANPSWRTSGPNSSNGPNCWI